MLKKIGAKVATPPLVVLQELGVSAVLLFVYIIKNSFELFLLVLKYFWDKSVKFRTRVANLFQYVGIFVASPAFKLYNDFATMRKEIRKQNRKKGFFAAAKVFLIHFIKFIFGKRGAAVTAFNYAAPIISIVFLFNVVAYAASSSYALKLTVNGRFLGYVESEQVFLDAEALVLQRVNSFANDRAIDISPEFSIEKIGFSETLTEFQVANLILKNSDFNLDYAYGFFIDGNFFGAITEDNIDRIRVAADGLLDKYRSSNPDEEVEFMNVVEYDKYELYLSETIVDPDDIINLITSKKRISSYYTVKEGDDQEKISEEMNMSAEEIERLNPGFEERELNVGDQIKKNDEEPYLPVSITRTEEYSQPIPYETEYRDTGELFVKAQQEYQRGVDGENHVVARVSYVNGIEISRIPIETTLVSEPIERIILNGTKPFSIDNVSTQFAEYGKFIWPTVSSGEITCGYGYDAQFARYHYAIDIAYIGYGSAIFAAGSGTVVLSEYNYYQYGHTIIIEHENGLRTLYSHNSELLVSEGEEVIQGQQIACAGMTGWATGTHLHFEVRDSSGAKLNPNNYLTR